MTSVFANRFAAGFQGPVPRGRDRRANRWAGTLAAAALLATLLPGSVSAATYSVSGTVTNAAGAGVIGIQVLLCTRVPAPGQQYITCVGSGAVSAADGTYAVPSVPAGTYRVTFKDLLGRYPTGYYSTGGFAPSDSSGTDVVVTSGDATGINIQYPAVYQISGAVTGPDGSPVANVQIIVCDVLLGSCDGGYASTAGNGTYSIAVVAGWYTVQAYDEQGNNFVPTLYSAAGLGGAPTNLDVRANVSGINIQFAAARHISGTLRATVGGQPEFVDISACGTGITPSTCYYALSQSDGTFRIAVPTGTFVLSFVDYAMSVLPGYWSSHGLVATSARATKIDVTAGDVSTVSASTGPIGVGAHAGTARTGTFSTKLVSVRRGSPVTVRFAFGKGFAGAKVSIWTAVAGSAGTLGSFRRTTSSVVRSDGYVFYTVPVKGLMAFRAQYLPPAENYWGDLPATSASVKAKGS